MEPNEQQLGIITEQGDLGLGFEPVSDEDQKTMEANDASRK